MIRVTILRKALILNTLVLKIPGAMILFAILALLSGCEGGELPNPLKGLGSGDAKARPLPEAGDLARVVAETRSILPRIPTPLREAIPAPTPTVGENAPPARRVLVGEGRLLRPANFPRLPTRLRVEVFLNDEDPPGGTLRITGPKGSSERWTLLTSHMAGQRDRDFTATFRVADSLRRLRYLVLLGQGYHVDGKAHRSLEGYLIHPAADGSLSRNGAVYPIDFGYRHPEPPAPVAAAQALGEAITALNGQYRRWLEDAREKGSLEDKMAALQTGKIPAEQDAQLKADVAVYARRIDALAEAARTQRSLLRSGLLRLYERRANLTRLWEGFRETNAYRWRDEEARRNAYLPLRALQGRVPDLERIYAAVDGDTTTQIRAARAAMEEAVLRENEIAPRP